MRIYVDFDDVLCETARELSRLAATLYGCRVPYAEIRTFNLREAFNLDQARYLHLMHTAHESDHLLQLEPTPDAVETLAAWSDEGHEVEIVTGRPWTTHPASKIWLERAGLGHLALIHLDKYNREPSTDADELSRALTLAEFSRRHYDLAVEDAPIALQMLAELESCRVVIFDRPWNRDMFTRHTDFIRCVDWQEIAPMAEQHHATLIKG